MRFKLPLKVCLALLPCLAAAPLMAASFDCGKAAAPAEKLVCASPAISSLDEELNKVYRGVMAEANAESRDRLIADQRRWLSQTRNACRDESCLEQAYSSRKADLQAFFLVGAARHDREKEQLEPLNDTDPFVTLMCDVERGSIYVAEGRADLERDIPQDMNVRPLNAMLRFVPVGSEDGRTEVTSRFEKKCQIGSATYMLTVVPYKFNHHVQGACGAVAPTVMLTVVRNGQAFVKDLEFRVNCFREPDDGTEIETVLLSEAEQRATFYIRKNGASMKRVVEYRKLPSMPRASLFK